jgi:hypothetical protein
MILWYLLSSVITCLISAHLLSFLFLSIALFLHLVVNVYSNVHRFHFRLNTSEYSHGAKSSPLHRTSAYINSGLPLPQFPHGGTPPGSRFSRDLTHMGSIGLSTQNFPEIHVLKSGPMCVDGPRFVPGLVQHQMQRPNELMLPPRHQHEMLPIKQSPPHFS